MAFTKFFIHPLRVVSLAFAMTTDLPITAVNGVGPVMPESYSLFSTTPMNGTFTSTPTFTTDLDSFTIQTSVPSSSPTELPGHRVFTGRPTHLTPPTPSPTEEAECIFLAGPRGLVEISVPADVVSVFGPQRIFSPVPPGLRPCEAGKDSPEHLYRRGPAQTVNTSSAATAPSLPSSRPSFNTVRTRAGGGILARGRAGWVKRRRLSTMLKPLTVEGNGEYGVPAMFPNSNMNHLFKAQRTAKGSEGAE